MKYKLNDTNLFLLVFAEVRILLRQPLQHAKQNEQIDNSILAQGIQNKIGHH